MRATELERPTPSHVVLEGPFAARWQQRRGRRRRRCLQENSEDGTTTAIIRGSFSGRPETRPVPCSLTLLAAVQPGSSGEQPQTASAAALLGGGCAAHAAMTALGCALGDAAGLGVTAQLVGTDLSLPAALGYTVPLAGMCLAGTAAAERLEEFARLKRVFQAELIPQLAQLPTWVGFP